MRIPAATARWFVVLAIACSADRGDTTDAGASGTSDGDTTGGETDDDHDPAAASNGCASAPDIGPGTWRGTLRNKDSELGGACGQGGPDAFFRVVAPYRADLKVAGVGSGFTPRIGLLAGDCTAGWDGAQLACTGGLPGWATDLAGGTEVIVSVGVDPNDPALGEGGPDGRDALAFEISLQLRRVLAAGAGCSPPELGRCVSGTACVESDDGASAVCTAVEADTCSSALDVRVGPGETVTTVDPAVLQTDAHEHECGGARRRERVYRLELSDGVGPDAAVEITADRADVGLAVRQPGCAAADEIACHPPGFEPPAVTIEGARSLAISGVRPFLFVELPGGPQPRPEDGPPFAVRMTVVPGG